MWEVDTVLPFPPALSATGSYFYLPNQQLKKLKNGMFDCFSWIWYNIITEGASEMKEKE